MDLVASELIGAAERTAMGGVLRLRAIIGRAYARCRGTRNRGHHQIRMKKTSIGALDIRRFPFLS